MEGYPVTTADIYNKLYNISANPRVWVKVRMVLSNLHKMILSLVYYVISGHRFNSHPVLVAIVFNDNGNCIFIIILKAQP